MGGLCNTSPGAGCLSLSRRDRLQWMSQLACAAELLKDGAVPAKHDELIRITPKLSHSFKHRTRP